MRQQHRLQNEIPTSWWWSFSGGVRRCLNECKSRYGIHLKPTGSRWICPLYTDDNTDYDLYGMVSHCSGTEFTPDNDNVKLKRHLFKTCGLRQIRKYSNAPSFGGEVYEVIAKGNKKFFKLQLILFYADEIETYANFQLATTLCRERRVSHRPTRIKIFDDIMFPNGSIEADFYYHYPIYEYESD